VSDTGAYPNRSDLRNQAGKIAKQVVPGQTYGQGAAQMRAQQAVPMGRSPVEAPVPQRPMPGSLGSFSRPSERPLEPITAGADFGPGPNSVMAGIPMPRADVSSAVQELRSIAMQYGSDDLLDLLDVYGDEL
jgi:hypothetical protein